MPQTFKANPCLERGLLAGITLAGVGSIFSDFNNLAVAGITRRKYETSFGFTEDEVAGLLDAHGLGEHFNEVKSLYDGYCFGAVKSVYNPWDITNFLFYRQFGSYWVDSGSSERISRALARGTIDVKQTLERLVSGQWVSVDVSDNVSFHDLDAGSDQIWSMLLAAGYLKTDGSVMHPDSCRVAVTNSEVLSSFRAMINSWFARQSVGCSQFAEALLEGNVGDMNAILGEMAGEMFGFFDVNGRAPEKFYHGFVLGMLVSMRDRFVLTSNRDSGYGRYDVMIEPRDKMRDDAFVLEFKVHRADSGLEMTDTLRAAKEQIRNRNYDADLIARGVDAGRIRHYGLVFDGKKVLVG